MQGSEAIILVRLRIDPLLEIAFVKFRTLWARAISVFQDVFTEDFDWVKLILPRCEVQRVVTSPVRDGWDVYKHSSATGLPVASSCTGVKVVRYKIVQMISEPTKVLPLDARVDLFLVALSLGISLLMVRTLGLLLFYLKCSLVLWGVHDSITDTAVGPLWNLVPLILWAAIALLYLHFLREQVECVSFLVRRFCRWLKFPQRRASYVHIFEFEV